MAGESKNLRWRLWLPLAVMAAIGIGGSIGSHYFPEQLDWLAHAVRDVSIAFIVAAVLGGTVDTFLKTELSRDVFNAAYSYLLPPELKQEITRIIQYKFLCEQHHMILTLSPLGEGLFKLLIRIERRIRNISREPQLLKNIVGLDDWGFDEKPKVEKCVMIIEGDEYTPVGPRTDLTEEATGVETESKSINYNQTALLITEAYEIKPGNSEFLINFRHPTVNPVVHVNVPEGFRHSFGFGVPAEDIARSVISYRYELKGAQFPGQFMRLRWWPSKA